MKTTAASIIFCLMNINHRLTGMRMLKVEPCRIALRCRGIGFNKMETWQRGNDMKN